MQENNDENQKAKKNQNPLSTKSYPVLFGGLFVTTIVAAASSIYSEYLGLFFFISGGFYFGGNIYYKIISGIFSKK